MRIGLDFDNTIACYDAVFQSIARERGYVSQSWSGSKAEARVAVRSRPQGELDWQRLQGQVYGKYMHLATVFPEVAKFLLRSQARNDELFIVSHKTEFGHYDPDKIPLREEALRWMRANHFFGASGLGLSEDNVFFANTREEKTGKIARLKCEVFIDDLWEVFAEPGFPNETRKILFQPESHDHNPELYALVSDSWREIAQFVFGAEEDVEEIEKQIGFAVGRPIKSVSAVVGRANSRIFKVEVGKESLAAKFYPDRARDPRDRLSAERNASEFVREHCTESALEFVSSTPALNMSLYRWVEGVAVTDILKKDVGQALEFVAQLQVAARAPSAELFPVASEACLCEEDLWSQICYKRRRLDKAVSSSGDLGLFLTEVFDPLVSRLARETYQRFPKRDRFATLPPHDRTLSPSDFGFHNAIRRADSRLVWIDFEYFGWDDPVKLIADFIWHPGFTLSDGQRTQWEAGCFEIFSSDRDIPERYQQRFPLFGLRWCLILLNVFLRSRSDRERKGQIQIEKARQYVSRIEKNLLQS